VWPRTFRELVGHVTLDEGGLSVAAIADEHPDLLEPTW